MKNNLYKILLSLIFFVPIAKAVKFENRSKYMIDLVIESGTKNHQVLLLSQRKFEYPHIDKCKISIDGEDYEDLPGLKDTDHIIFSNHPKEKVLISKRIDLFKPKL